MGLFTLAFPNYPTAQAAAQALGFWDADVGQLKTDGQSQGTNGEWFGWNITYCGPRTVTPAVRNEAGEVITPAVISSEVYAIVTGQLPPGADAYLAPFYGYSGHLYAGTEPGPH